MTEQQAIAIAQMAVDNDPFFSHFACNCVAATDSAGAQWRCATITIGSGLIVVIDDASGDVLKIERWGLR
jgi:hypothetical protein